MILLGLGVLIFLVGFFWLIDSEGLPQIAASMFLMILGLMIILGGFL